MKVLVTGANGQLGYDVIKRLNALGDEPVGADREEFDITDGKATEDYICHTPCPGCQYSRAFGGMSTMCTGCQETWQETSVMEWARKCSSSRSGKSRRFNDPRDS